MQLRKRKKQMFLNMENGEMTGFRNKIFLKN